MASTKLKICHILAEPPVDEAEALSLHLSSTLLNKYNFSFVLLGDTGLLARKLQGAGFSVDVVGRRRGQDWRCSQRLFGLLRREGADLIHAHQSLAFFHVLMARLFYKRPPILFTEHARPYPDNPPGKQIVTSRMLLEGRDRIVAASQSVRRALILNERIPPDRVEVIYNAIVPPPAVDPSSERPSVRREIGVEADTLLVLQIAPFETAQDHALAIRAFEQVVRDLPGVRLALSGDGPELGPIREMVRQRGLGSHVLFLGRRDDNARLLAAADLAILTSLSEGIPSILIQALSAGLPVVATRVGCVGEIVEDRVCGLLVCPGDYGTLAEHIRRLHDDPAQRARLGQRSRERFESMFSAASTWLGYSQMYQTMLSPQ